MSEITGISSVGFYQENSKTAKADRQNHASFSSYMEETKSLDEIFERAAQKYDVPLSLLKGIGKAESDFRPSVVSRSGAQGIMQLMPGTAAELGVTDAFDPEQNIMGGAKYISQLMKKYDGDVKLALAAYNAGMNNVKKYGGIPPFQETQNYVVKVTGYMNQNITAGNVRMEGDSYQLVKGSTSITENTAKQTPYQLKGASFSWNPAISNLDRTAGQEDGEQEWKGWHTLPSEMVKQEGTSDSSITELLDAIFSYRDYMKLLDLFYR